MGLTRTGDTKYGRLIGTDVAGNKYFENTDELPRTYILLPSQLKIANVPSPYPMG